MRIYRFNSSGADFFSMHGGPVVVVFDAINDTGEEVRLYKGREFVGHVRSEYLQEFRQVWGDMLERQQPGEGAQ